jgi:orotidine-5'-phosphate decarboxylase
MDLGLRADIALKERLIVALDYPARHEAWQIVNRLADHVSFYSQNRGNSC